MKKSVLKTVAAMMLFMAVATTYSQNDTTVETDSVVTSTTIPQDSVQSGGMMQEETSTLEENKRWFFGCGFGLNFVGGTSLSLSPNINYLISEKVSVGAGLQGNYISIKDVQSTTTIGGSLIAQYTPVNILTTLLEFNQLNVSTKRETVAGEVKDDFWESALFVGAGLNVSKNISLGVKYNVLYDDDESVYTSPILPFVTVNF